jgi:hypothetical protein
MEALGDFSPPAHLDQMVDGNEQVRAHSDHQAKKGKGPE